jgi:hypothetical protein
MIAVRCIVGSLLVFAGIARGENDRPKRTTMPIGTSWSLTAERHERTITEGTRTKLLTSTGGPVLKHGANVIKGPWDIEAKAAKIECDFAAKKFILSGSPELRRFDPATRKLSSTITAQARTSLGMAGR